ncbi:MAG: alpha-glucan family phosphorylase [Bacteroidales bacterium]|nr:alpha-glucan family phosphorylase [Bacteroidales bacterium]
MMTTDFLFETSWEVCNKVGGIHTVLSTKARTLIDELNDNYIMIGPDVCRNIEGNAEFLDDQSLYNGFRLYAERKGLHLKVGRWNIVGKPVVFLVDFSDLFHQKNTIFSHYWEEYKLDSLSGQWDYIEPMLFGYAAGRVIESYYEYYISSIHRVVAHFHEWMTGSGILYLKEYCPQIATVFTTHATVLGRCIAGNGLPLYKDMEHYQPAIVAANFGVVAKQSLETMAAMHCDAFSTVSSITDRECRQFLGRNADRITPNGFSKDLAYNPDVHSFMRRQVRTKIINVLERLLNQRVEENAMFVLNSGRYEFHNKGIDVFIDALGRLNASPSLNHEVVAVIAIPAHHVEVNPYLSDAAYWPDFDKPLRERYTTHNLYDYDNDPIIQSIKKNSLFNSVDDKVKVLFIPSYLNGDDGAVNHTYLDFLTAFDVSVFPSYYEPWGYTPMESMALGVPTLTTSLAGFGSWLSQRIETASMPIGVIARNDGNYSNVVDEIASKLLYGTTMSNDDFEVLKQQSIVISAQMMWEKFIAHYSDLYDDALLKARERKNLYNDKIPYNEKNPIALNWGNEPEWRKVFIRPILPKNIEDLRRLAANFWWSWNGSAIALFESIDRALFEKCNRDPNKMLAMLSAQKFDELSQNEEFLKTLRSVMDKFDAYMSRKSDNDSYCVAYFSMEFGIHDSLKIYSGGLGMLAGDYLKQASDSNKNMIGIGLLYRNGYFVQHITKSGEQMSHYVPQVFSQLPLTAVHDRQGNWQKISVAMPGRIVYAKVWRSDIGKVPLYLLDTDIEENNRQDRNITGELYGGDSEMRLKQEILLGIGGVRLLEELGVQTDVYHNNEGHSAFSCLERLRNFVVEQKMAVDEAIELVRASTLYTTHTAVPAGHDSFDEELMRVYFYHFCSLLKVSWDEFMAFGRFGNRGDKEKFSMSLLAIHFSQQVNGVSEIHGKVSREMFAPLFPGYFPEELFISHVTNGVHFPTWVANSWLKLYTSAFGEEFLNHQSNEKYWLKIHNVDDSTLWHTHLQQKEQLLKHVEDRLKTEFLRRAEDPKLWLKTVEKLNPKALTIGFARRFATYKRANLIFTNLDRLAKIVGNQSQPVQFIFAGKAHPNDGGGKDLIKKIIEISKRPEFVGKIIFLENYDMNLAKYLIHGVDVWLNVPQRPLEASGTSGQKATMNGVLNFSVLDGWWAEGYRDNAGWALPKDNVYENQEYQNTLDSETIYSVLEEKIIPTFYDYRENNVPKKWVAYIKNSISGIAPHYTMERQLNDYYADYYDKLYHRYTSLTANNGARLKETVGWKRRLRRAWNTIELIDLQYPDSRNRPLDLGEEYTMKVVLQLTNISAKDIGVEAVFVENKDGKKQLLKTIELEVADDSQGRVTYSKTTRAILSGVYECAFRIYPKSKLLPHRQDLPLIKWV